MENMNEFQKKEFLQKQKEEKKQINDEKKLNNFKFVIVDKKKYDHFQKLKQI